MSLSILVIKSDFNTLKAKVARGLYEKTCPTDSATTPVDSKRYNL